MRSIFIYKVFLILFAVFLSSCNYNPLSITQKDLSEEEIKELMLDRYSPSAFGGSLVEDSTTLLVSDLNFIIQQMENIGVKDVSEIKKENIVKIEKPFDSEVLVTDLIIKNESVTLVYCYFPNNFALATIFSPDAFNTVITEENTSRESKGAWLLNAYVTSGIANPVYQFKTIEKNGDKYRTKMLFKPTPGESALEQMTDDSSEDEVQENE